MLLLKLSLCFLSLVAHSTLTAALNITVSSQFVEAPGPISFALATDPTDPDPQITHMFNVSNSVNTSFPSYIIGSNAAISQFALNGTAKFNLPPLPESGGWVITVQLSTPTGGGGSPELGPIIATSNTFSVTPGPQPKRFVEHVHLIPQIPRQLTQLHPAHSTQAATGSPRKPISAAVLALTIGGIVIVVAIAGWLVIPGCRWRISRKRSLPSIIEEGRSRGPEPRASAAPSDSLPEKAPWSESGKTV
ncbi:hypothetical protein GGX14DRAFT_562768 [Mycena pura]|uniref:Mid2 domain-containing protein n=1 Tax=Mycena pura TaxID=153505 RepID=A0AAD6VKC5_9AGAR|nr:hypothetical protein GGX14DRAFT_562768 [Mycena pura]